MHFRTVRIQTDLHLLDTELSDSRSFFGPDHHSVGLQLHIEAKRPRILENLKAIPAHERLAATDAQEECAGVGKLAEDVLDLIGGHLALIVVIEIAVNALFIAAP